MWREKYRALQRELEQLKRRMREQSEEEIQELTNQKRASDKAVSALYINVGFYYFSQNSLEMPQISSVGNIVNFSFWSLFCEDLQVLLASVKLYAER